MRSIINYEIAGLLENIHETINPYPNNDRSIGRYLRKSEVIRNFAEQLLLYDRIYIVTNFYPEVLFLREIMGGSILQRLLHDGTIQFIQIPFKWVYIQKWKKEQGHRSLSGIATASLANPKHVNGPQAGVGDPSDADFGGLSSTDLEEAVTTALLQTGQWHEKRVGKFARLIASNSKQIRGDQFTRFITNKSEEDLKNKELRDSLDFSKDIDVENIPDNSQDIRRLFRLIKANEVIAVINNMPSSDLLAEDFFASAFTMPINQEIKAKKISIDATDLFTINKVATPKELGEKYLSIPEIVKLRESSGGQEFRRWFHNNFSSGEDIQSAYVELLKKDIPFKYKFVYSLAQTILGAVLPLQSIVGQVVAGQAISLAGDYTLSNMIEKYLKPNPPKFFMNKISKTISSKP